LINEQVPEQQLLIRAYRLSVYHNNQSQRPDSYSITNGAGVGEGGGAYFIWS